MPEWSLKVGVELYIQTSPAETRTVCCNGRLRVMQFSWDGAQVLTTRRWTDAKNGWVKG